MSKISIPSALIILFLTIPVISLFSVSDEYRTGPEPFWVEDIAVPAYAPTAEEISNGEFYLLSDIQVNREEREYFNHYALILSNSTGLENNSQISIDFDPAYEELTVHKVRVIRDGEVHDKLDGAITSVIQQEKELESLLYNGTKSFYAILSDIRIGDVLEVSFSIKEFDSLFSGINDRYYVEWGVPVRRVFRRLIIDGQAPLKYRTGRETEAPEIRNGRDYRWTFTDARPVEYEENVPYWFDAFNFIEVSQYADWEAVREEIMDLYAPLSLSPDQAETILSNYPEMDRSNQEEAVKTLLDAVQEQIRYMGIEIGRGSYIPTPPLDVYNRRFGDCKDKTLLFTGLLNHLGIDAWPVLVHNSEGKKLIDALPGPFQFNHVIAKVMIGEITYWLDPTYTFQEGDLENVSTPLYGYGLVLSDESRGLEEITSKFTGNNIVINEIFTLPGDINETGEYTIETIYFDEDADYMRSWLSNSPDSEIAEEMHEYMSDYYSGIQLTGDFSYIDSPEENKITFTESYRIPGIWEYFSDGDKYQFTYSPYEIYNYTYEPGTGERTMPYHLRHPFRLEQNARIKLPEEWNVDKIDDLIETDHFVYHQKTVYDDKEIALSYLYESKRDSVSPDEMIEYTEGMQKISSGVDYIIFWNPEKEKSPGGSGSRNYGSAAISLMLAAYLIFRVINRRRKSVNEIH